MTQVRQIRGMVKARLATKPNQAQSAPLPLSSIAYARSDSILAGPKMVAGARNCRALAEISSLFRRHSRAAIQIVDPLERLRRQVPESDRVWPQRGKSVALAFSTEFAMCSVNPSVTNRS